YVFFFFSSRRRHTRFSRDWSSDVCSSDLPRPCAPVADQASDRSTLMFGKRATFPDTAASRAPGAGAAPETGAAQARQPTVREESDRKSVVEGKRGGSGRRRRTQKEQADGA